MAFKLDGRIEQLTDEHLDTTKSGERYIEPFTPLCAPAQTSQAEITASGFQAWVEARWGQRPKPVDLAVMTIGLMGEITEVMQECHDLAVAGGRVAEHVKKEIRGSKIVDIAKLKLELGDVLHYLTIIATHYGISLSDVMGANVDKLTLRQQNTEPNKQPPPMGDGHPMAR